MILKSCNIASKVAALVLVLCGAVGEKSSSSHEAFHAAFKTDVHHQVKHGDIAGLEKTVLAFAKVGKATPGMEVFLIQILNITGGMKNDLAVQRDNAQDALTSSWYHFLNCSYIPADDPDRDLVAKNNSHRNCSQNESWKYDEYMQCTAELADLNLTSTTYCALVPLKCQPIPVSCLDDPVQNGSVLPFLQEKYNYFNAKYNECKGVEDGCTNATSKTNETGSRCDDLYNQWQALVGDCNSKQSDLEKAACGDWDFNKSNCYEYQTCYTTRKAVMEANNGSAKQVYEDNYDAYRGLLRIECYLRAFNKSIAEGADLGDEIDICKNTRYSGCVTFGQICPDYPPFVNETVPDLTNCSYCPFSVNESLQPGTAEWTQAYYSNMPANTSYQACDASCCDMTATTTVIGATTTIIGNDGVGSLGGDWGIQSLT